MSWRYQPVVMESRGEDFLTLIEVHLVEGATAAGPLDSWTATVSDVSADDRASLVQSLASMLNEAMAWTPVRLADLKAGMMFEADPTYQRKSREEIWGPKPS